MARQGFSVAGDWHQRRSFPCVLSLSYARPPVRGLAGLYTRKLDQTTSRLRSMAGGGFDGVLKDPCLPPPASAHEVELVHAPARTLGASRIGATVPGLLHLYSQTAGSPATPPDFDMRDVIRSVELSSKSISAHTRTVVDVLRNIEKRLPGIGDRFSCAEERMPAVEECRAGVERREQSLEDSGPRQHRSRRAQPRESLVQAWEAHGGVQDAHGEIPGTREMDGGQSRCSSLSPAMRDAGGLQHRDE
ncbi:hypothetical protein C8Q76DRAFT_247225 [Earliella scabrosa]|nr:hypothetical protein C8Q76DRAFT_247225 [Earliella scabrosa]